MELKKSVAHLCLPLILLLCLSKVCHAQLMCYVCDNCAQITAETPLFECNEDFLESGGQTPTELPKSTTVVSASQEPTTTTMTSETTYKPLTTKKNTDTTATITSTATAETNDTTRTSTEHVYTDDLEVETTTNTTVNFEDYTPSTDQPPSSANVTSTHNEITKTTTITMTSETTYKPLTTNKSTETAATITSTTTAETDDTTRTSTQHVNTDDLKVETTTNTTVNFEDYTPSTDQPPSSSVQVRQLRSISDEKFYCFKFAATVNNSMVVNRGCARVPPSSTDCPKGVLQHSNAESSKCYYCSRSKCNNSSTLSVSITALFVAVVAVFIHQK